MRRLLLGGAFAARGCSLGVRKRLLLRDLPLRGAARLGKGRSCFLGRSRCAGLLDYRLQTRGGCFWGSSRCAGLLDRSKEEAAFGGAPAARGCWITDRRRLEAGERKKLLFGELPLRGAAGLQTGGGCFWGSSRCAGLLDWGKEEAAFWGAPAAQGCWITDYRQEEAAFGGAPAARGCWIGEMQRLLWGELPLRGAAR